MTVGQAKVGLAELNKREQELMVDIAMLRVKIAQLTHRIEAIGVEKNDLHVFITKTEEAARDL